MAGNLSSPICVGEVTVMGAANSGYIVRARDSTGVYPTAAPVSVLENRRIQLTLEPHSDPSKEMRNGARAYFATSCKEGKYDPETYASWQLLGRSEQSKPPM